MSGWLGRNPSSCAGDHGGCDQSNLLDRQNAIAKRNGLPYHGFLSEYHTDLQVDTKACFFLPLDPSEKMSPK